MSDELRAVLAAGALRDRAEDFIATVASLSPFEVRWRGEQVGAVDAMGDTLFVVGDTVRVLQFSEQLVVYGKQSVLPVLAIVSAYTSSSANVTVVAGDDTFDAQILGSGWTPAVGDRVAIQWTSSGPFAQKRGGAVASPPNPPLPPDNMNATSGPDLPTPKPPSATSAQATVYAAQTGTYLNNGSLYTGQQARYWLYGGNDNTPNAYAGMWFYGDRLSVVRSVTVTKFEIWLQRATGVGPSTAANIPLIMHSSKTRPSTQPADSSPSFTSNTISLKPGQSGWFTLPTNWGQLLAAGTYAGIGLITLFGDDPWKALIGIDHPDSTKKSALSGALRFTYKRS